jgi:hypothetical protein
VGVGVGPAVPARLFLVVPPLPPLARLAAAAAAKLAGSAAASAAVAVLAVLPAPDLPGKAAVAVAVAAAVGKAAAAGLDVMRGGVGPVSRQGVREPLAGAGSQSCTVENCIFVMKCARLCSY